ncbi:putative phage associated protein [Neisseria meningitidis]|nr:hypothetical protein JY77_06610 [Neisseria meningitidis]CWN11229.1 putative phage associated protein [Neisseria meningitidis]CWQ39672.1 putative phage associated protein [Neisseria meningitidis]CWR73338.1 putative phage associated protein [Neisseria meningitidis]CWT48146.1 putative phage associated protein [Neisseria meningitidis]
MLPHTGLFLLGKVALQMRIRHPVKLLVLLNRKIKLFYVTKRTLTKNLDMPQEKLFQLPELLSVNKSYQV